MGGRGCTCSTYLHIWTDEVMTSGPSQSGVATAPRLFSMFLRCSLVQANVVGHSSHTHVCIYRNMEWWRGRQTKAKSSV